MNTFISKTLSTIVKEQENFKDVVFVLPSQRAGVFVKNELKNQVNIGFLPKILDIEHFIESVSQLKKIDSIQLLFYFYSIYKEQHKEPETFDHFSSWALTALQDFNEIDQYLVNEKDLFVYVRDIQRLKKWSVKGTFKETALMKDHFAFMEKLGDYYEKLYKFLLVKGVGYQGLLYREATKKVDSYISENQHKTYYFIGFNALNKAEEFLFQSFLNTGNSQVFWDIDASLLNSNHQAATFIKKYLSEWKYYEKNEAPVFENELQSQKHIEVIGATKNLAQIKYAGNILNRLPSLKNTALVLSDESLLTATLSSLPTNQEGINITMGYPLKDTPTSQFIHDYFQLFLTQERLDKVTTNEFYFKDFWRFVKNPTILKLFTPQEINALLLAEEESLKENRAFISYNKAQQIFTNLSNNSKEILNNILGPLQNTDNFIARVLQIIDQLKSFVNTLEREYLFRFHNAFQQLATWNTAYQYFSELTVLHRFYQQIIKTETISFQGEPLKGLQVMGMLETRVLDFENVIITSVNEGVLPKNSTQATLIPFDVKNTFGLPTYKEKDAIYSYHFFRLLQKANTIFLIYNTDTDDFGKGEKSRFLSQLALMRNDINYKNINTPVVTEKQMPIVIAKNEDIVNSLHSLAKNGISPSAIGNYLRNPIDFYKKSILGLKDVEELEETVAYNTMGTIVHETLYTLYLPFVEKILTLENLKAIEEKVDNEVEAQFVKEYKEGDFSTGKNKLIYEVAKKYVNRFIAVEKEQLTQGNTIKIIALEQKLETTVDFYSLEKPIKLKGFVDRIDSYNGQTRIIDYKTGMVGSSELKLLDFSDMADNKYSKAIQIMLYAYLYTKNNSHNFSQGLLAGIYSFKNLNAGFLSMNFTNKRHIEDNNISQEKLEEFLQGLELILAEIFNRDIPFEEKLLE